MPFQVRDNRGGNWFWLHNVIVDEHAARLGPYAVAVYLNLCRHVGQKQETWVGQKTIAHQMGMSERQVRRELAALAEAGLIEVEERIEDTGQKTNIYTLLPPPVSQSGGEDSQSGPPGQSVQHRPDALITKNKNHGKRDTDQDYLTGRYGSVVARQLRQRDSEDG